MADGGRTTKSRDKGKGDDEAVPKVYQEMLAEALPSRSTGSRPPLKRRNIGARTTKVAANTEPSQGHTIFTEHDDEDVDEELEFEDVVDVFGEVLNPSRSIQTAYIESDDDSADNEPESDMSFKGDSKDEMPSGNLELTLNPKVDASQRITTERRRLITKEERLLRLQVHKMHILCLLSHVESRNRWCNSAKVQDALQPLMSKKMLTFLLPKSSLSQFGRTESLKRGLEQVCLMWRTKYNIAVRGMQRALWTDNKNELQRLKLAADTDSVYEMSDFLNAALAMQGSRDVGAQLFCAMLRSAGLDVRLVCSLQTLPFIPGGPTSNGASQAVQATGPEIVDREKVTHSIQRESSPILNTCHASDLRAAITPRRKLGRGSPAGCCSPEMRPSSRPPPKPKTKKISESPYPVYWIEVLDEAHQKWLPVDPMVTHSVAKPNVFEPPASDRENNMSYVIAFEDDGNARDVTKRYTKAFNAKTRKQRVDFTERGIEWLRKAMRPYTRRWQTDLDQVEDAELAAAEAREPMPRNIADFKDHPYYALERYLKRNEILVTRHEVGKIAAGKDPNTPGRKKLESIYRRGDIKVGKSSDAWYRLGRDVKMGERPIKTVHARRRPDVNEEEGGQAIDMDLFTHDQTEIYVPPPVVNGKVPKNSFGNVDIYVSSMVPPGGVHIPDEHAARAARLLGIDYADALTGFEFRGRHGTAVLTGVVVAADYQNAVEAVLDSYRDEQTRIEEEIRAVAALKLWKRVLMELRIKERVDAYGLEDEDAQDQEILKSSSSEGDDSDEYIDDTGGGFCPE